MTDNTKTLLVTSFFKTGSIYTCRGNKKKSKSVPEKLQNLPSITPVQGFTAVDEVTSADLPTENADGLGSVTDNETTRAHVYFKDLKLLADGGESDEEDQEEIERLSDGSSLASPVGDYSNTAYAVRYTISLP
jgi:hypothetical protein